MRVINSFEAVTLDNITLFCCEMTDGSTWFFNEASQVVRSTDDDLINGGFTIKDLYSIAIFETFDNIKTLDLFVANVNQYLTY